MGMGGQRSNLYSRRVYSHFLSGSGLTSLICLGLRFDDSKQSRTMLMFYPLSPNVSTKLRFQIHLMIISVSCIVRYCWIFTGVPKTSRFSITGSFPVLIIRLRLTSDERSNSDETSKRPNTVPYCKHVFDSLARIGKMKLKSVEDLPSIILQQNVLSFSKEAL